MHVFFDTTVLVAASVRAHPHHAQALAALQRVVAGKDAGVLSAHSIAEVYAALTRVPVVPRIQPTEAARILAENILPFFQAIPLTRQDYLDALRAVEEGGWIGAKIYDALLLRGAAKANVDRIYTFNLADFLALAPAALRPGICAPS